MNYGPQKLQWKNSNQIKLKHQAAANFASRRETGDQSAPQHLKHAAPMSHLQRQWEEQEALEIWTKACTDGGRGERCQTARIFFWLGKVKQRLSGWRRAHRCVPGSMPLCSSWSFICPAKFSIWWHTQSGWYFFLKTTKWYYFILILKSNSIPYKSVKCDVEWHCFLNMDRSNHF